MNRCLFSYACLYDIGCKSYTAKNRQLLLVDWRTKLGLQLLAWSRRPTGVESTSCDEFWVCLQLHNWQKTDDFLVDWVDFLEWSHHFDDAKISTQLTSSWSVELSWVGSGRALWSWPYLNTLKVDDTRTIKSADFLGESRTKLYC